MRDDVYLQSRSKIHTKALTEIVGQGMLGWTGISCLTAKLQWENWNERCLYPVISSSLITTIYKYHNMSL